LRLVGNIAAAVMMALAVVSLLGVTLLPNILGYKTYTVLSGSMEPAIHTGSVLFAEPVPPGVLKVGDVIVYNRSDVNESVTHRIIEIKTTDGKPEFTTKGDANGSPDSWTVQYNDMAGKVVLAIPLAGYIYHALGSPQGRTIFLIVPVLGLTLMWLWQIWKPETRLQRRDVEIPKPIAPEPEPAAGPIAASAAEGVPEHSPDTTASSLPLRN
jgi:signal peptidase